MAKFLADHSLLIVNSISSDAVGGFTLSLARGFSLDVFPDSSQQDEHWRFFKPISDEPHAVMAGKVLHQ
jgi:hypothetical protein